MKYVSTIFHQFPFFFAVRLLLLKISARLFSSHSKDYYSQTGEDAILQFLIEKEKGFFVDVGCNHPILYSNTFNLYKKGWTGINIDGNPGLIRLFNCRPNDIAVCEIISDEAKEMEFHEFEESVVSTVDPTLLAEWKEKWTFKQSRKVKSKTLTQVLEEHAIKDEIQLLCIDVEGHEFEVLRSLNFEKYRPVFILIEMHHFNIKMAASHKVVEYLDERGYDLVGFVTFNGYFKLRSAA